VPAVDVATALRFWLAVEGVGDVTEVLHHDIEVHDFDLPDAGIYQGVEGFAQWLGGWSAPWEEWGGTLNDLLDLGDQVVSLTHLHARASGLKLERDESQLIAVRDGKIARLEYFGDAHAALERAQDPERAATRKLVHEKIRALYKAAVGEDVAGVVAHLAPHELPVLHGARAGARGRGIAVAGPGPSTFG
jgi:ketosteroid isomerase-like protein